MHPPFQISASAPAKYSLAFAINTQYNIIDGGNTIYTYFNITSHSNGTSIRCVAVADDGVVVSDPAGFAYGYSTEGGYTICMYMTNKADDGANLSLTCKVTYLATVLSSLH